MAENNASGFVDFNQYYAANKDAEDALLQRALEAAQGNDAAAQKLLVKSKQQAIDGGVGELSQAGSYGDYLKAKQKASDAWRALQNTGSDPLRSAVREKLGAQRGLSGMADAASADLATREQNLGGWVSESYAGAQAEKARRAALAEKKAADEAKAKAENDKARADYNAALQKRAAAYWAAQDKDRALNFNPFRTHGQNNLWTPDAGWRSQQGNEQRGMKGDPSSDSYYTNAWGTTSDAQQLDQQLRNAGLTAEADKFSSNAEYRGGKRTSGGW